MAKILDYVKPRELVSASYLEKRGDEIYSGALEKAEDGATYGEICKALKIGPRTLRHICREDERFRQQLEQAMEAASTMVLEELKNVPFSETDAAMARVKIEALRTYLELRWPHLYGKRLDITVRTLDMRQALDMARQRAAARTQAIDITSESQRISTDSQSVDSEITPPDLAALLE